jgi:hypothetical protein
MPVYVHERHDVGIVRTDGTKVGLMLARDQYDNPIYQTTFDKPFAAPRYSSSPDYGSFDPENEIWMIGTDWRSGFGLEVANSDDPYRYYSSLGCDLRHRGQVLLSWGTNTIAVTTPTTVISTWPTFANLNCEATGTWSAGARDATHAHSGTYGWKVTNTTAAQSATNWTTDWQSKQFVVKAWVWDAAAANSTIEIYDGVGSTASAAHSGGSSFEQLTATHTLNASATELTIRFISGATDAWFDDAGIFTDYVATAASGDNLQVEYNDETYAAMGNVLAKLNAAGTVFTKVLTLPDIVTDMEVFSDDNLYIAMGFDTAYNYINTSETLTAATDANPFYEFFATVHTASPTLYGNDAVNKIRSTVDPTAGGTAWGAQTTVDSSTYSIIDLKTWKGSLYIRKTDTVYYLDSSSNVQDDLCPELESLYSSTFTTRMFVWKNKLYIPAGSQSLLETDATTNTFLDPSNYCTNLSDFVGVVEAVSGDEQYLYVAINNSANVEILAGREEAISGTTSWVWHPLIETAGQPPYLHVSTKVAKRLWINPEKYMPLPTTYGDITGDGNRSFITGGTWETPWLHGNFRATPKAFTELTLDMGHTYDENVYWTVKYKILGDTAWTTIGNFDGASGNMVETIAIPADSGSVEPSSNMMKLQFTGVTDSTSLTPILLSYHLKGVLYPTTRNIIECAIVAGEEVRDKDGQPLDGTSAADVRTVLEEARDATFPFTFYDPWGTSHTVKMLSMSPFSRIIKDEQEPEKIKEIFQVRLQKTPIHS